MLRIIFTGVKKCNVKNVHNAQKPQKINKDASNKIVKKVLEKSE